MTTQAPATPAPSTLSTLEHPAARERRIHSEHRRNLINLALCAQLYRRFNDEESRKRRLEPHHALR